MPMVQTLVPVHGPGCRFAWSRIFAASFTLAVAALARAETIPVGQLIERIECADEAAHSYALYLPSSCDGSKPLPVVYCFDPRARGIRAIERFRDGAEKFGYILVGSNNSRNGPWESNAKAAQILVRDTVARLPIHRQRIYTAGLSGGARVAVRLAMTGLSRGVIACGAGFPGDVPEQVGFSFFGTAGVDDCNYDELRRVDDELDKRGSPHRVALFTGGHEWPPAALGVEAIEWLEIEAMRSALRGRDEAMIDAVFRVRLAAIPTAQPGAWLETKSLAADFRGLRDTADLEKQAKEMEASREIRDWRKLERRAESEVQNVVSEIVESAMSGVIEERIIATRRKQADAADDSPRRRVARRALQGASISLEQSARSMGTAGDYAMAATLFEAVLAVQPDRTGVYFDLARAHAMDRKKKAAIADLQRGAAAGYSDPDRVEKEEAFESLRTDPAFPGIIAAMTRNAAAKKQAEARSAPAAGN